MIFYRIISGIYTYSTGERAKSVVPCYMGKPYTATTVNLMGRDIVLSLESSGFCRIKVRRGSSLSLYLKMRYRSNY